MKLNGEAMQKSSMDSGSGIWNDVSHQPGRVRERGLVSKNEADCNFDVRQVRVLPGVTTTEHAHAWAQANFVLSGKGEVYSDGKSTFLEKGDFVYLEPQARHVFKNSSESEPFEMLCIHGAKQ
jgi:quercetin dioxygenase-like cupin family protein